MLQFDHSTPRTVVEYTRGAVCRTTSGRFNTVAKEWVKSHPLLFKTLCATFLSWCLLGVASLTIRVLKSA